MTTTTRRPRRALTRLDEPTTSAYLAGLIDAYGGRIGINVAHGIKGTRYPSHSLWVSHTTTSPELLDWLTEEIGGSVVLNSDYGRESAASYKWRTFGSNAGALVAAIRPYLVRKHEQADVALAFRETIQRGGIPLTERLYQRRVRLKAYMDHLNVREVE